MSMTSIPTTAPSAASAHIPVACPTAMPHGDSVNHSVETAFLRQLKVMVLDDEPYNCLVVRKHLRDAGYTSVVAISNSRDYLRGQIEEVERAAQRMIRELGAEVADSWWDFVESEPDGGFSAVE